MNWLRHDGRAQITSALTDFLRDVIGTAVRASAATISALTISWTVTDGSPFLSTSQATGSIPYAATSSPA